jgi:hypothetical protein
VTINTRRRDSIAQCSVITNRAFLGEYPLPGARFAQTPLYDAWFTIVHLEAYGRSERSSSYGVSGVWPPGKVSYDSQAPERSEPPPGGGLKLTPQERRPWEVLVEVWFTIWIHMSPCHINHGRLECLSQRPLVTCGYQNENERAGRHIIAHMTKKCFR